MFNLIGFILTFGIVLIAVLWLRNRIKQHKTRILLEAVRIFEVKERVRASSFLAGRQLQ
jgi:hypothetical protein